MRDSRLILIDGLPGSGKTTTARLLAAALARRGFATSCFLEDQADHPLNVGGALHPAGRTPGTDIFARYSAKAYVDESLARWQAFAAEASGAGVVQILESYPYQNSVRVLLQMDLAAEQIRAYAAAVERIARPLQPVLIYLHQRDASGALRQTIAQRGPDWSAYVARLVADSPYGRRRKLAGEAGALAFLEDYRALLDELRGASSLPTLVLEDCANGWETCHRRILRYLQIEELR